MAHPADSSDPMDLGDKVSMRAIDPDKRVIVGNTVLVPHVFSGHKARNADINKLEAEAVLYTVDEYGRRVPVRFDINDVPKDVVSQAYEEVGKMDLPLDQKLIKSRQIIDRILQERQNGQTKAIEAAEQNPTPALDLGEPLEEERSAAAQVTRSETIRGNPTSDPTTSSLNTGVENAAADPFSCLDIPNLGTTPQPPSFTVTFTVPNIGDIPYQFHWVVEESSNVVLCYDTRYGPQVKLPTIQGDEPLTLNVINANTSWQVWPDWATFSFGIFNYSILWKA